MGFLFYLSLNLFLLIALILCFVILIQESKSLGLGASFGGDSGESIFGTSTADVLKKFTAWVAVAFLVGSIFLSIWSESGSNGKVRPIPYTIEEEAGE
ncbi:MAG: preprotein translocase subunit SecG [Verrucomicrobia bacterium]|nr:preprotein translocase subunit SecG [Verrucomicrobiota bacterium]